MGDEKAPKIAAPHARDSAGATDAARVGSSPLAWQDQFGNAALTRLLPTRTLRIGRRDSPHEREAERVASMVVSTSSSVPSIGNRTEAATEHASSPAFESSLAALRGSGEPLPLATRAALEPRFDHDFSDVRVHAGARAADAARAIHARAFTTGRDIVFGSGLFRPDTHGGQALLAHELTHVVQQRGSGESIVQGEFESDFAGRTDVPAEPNLQPPPRTIRVEIPATQTEPARWVYAPYGIYSPTEVPEMYRDRSMTSTKASEWRLMGEGNWPATAADFDREYARGEGRHKLTIREMQTLEEGPGSAMNIRVIVAKVGNDFRFVGYDMTQISGSEATGFMFREGFVEAEARTTKGVGQALFADRVVRALSTGAGIHAQVYHSQRTEDFHARIFVAARRTDSPPGVGGYYILTTRELINVALAWSETLTPGQFFALHELARQRDEPTRTQAQAAVFRGSVVKTSGTALVPPSEMVAGTIDTSRPGRGTTGGTPGPGTGAPATEPPAAEHTAAMARLQRLLRAQETLRIWRPVVDAQGADQKRAVDEELKRIDESVTDLTQRLRTSDAAARARVKGPAPVAAADAAYEASVKALAAPTASESAIGESGFRGLEELRQRSIEQVPIQVALNEAVMTGRYSDRTFRLMLSQIDPAARDSILYTPRGGLRPREVVFRRVAAYFRGSMDLPSGHTVSMSGISGGKLAVTRGAAGALLALEAANFAAQSYQSKQMQEETLRRKNKYPFVRRFLFWQRLGVLPAIVAVDDDFLQWSPDYERDFGAIAKDLDAWDAFFIEDTPDRPCLSDMEVLHLAANLAFLVRNFDEFAREFISSGQDAVTWDTPPGEGWAKAKWFVRVGEYDTDWQNSVVERWAYVPRLNELMNVMAARIIANTEELLKMQAEGKALSGEDSPLGGFLAWGPDKGAKKARLRDNESTTTVYTLRMSGGLDYPRGGGERIPRKVTWWSPPVFYVHDYTPMGFVTVTGADYNTYAVLRRTSYEYIGAKQLDVHARESQPTYVAENAKAVVEIPWLLLDIET